MYISIKSDTVIDLPPDDVFNFVAVDHINNHPRWDPHVVRILPATHGPLRAGSRFEIVRRTLGREETRRFEVVDWARPARFTIEHRSSDFSLTLASRLDAVGARRTQLTLSARASVSGPRALLAPIMKLKFSAELRHNLSRIKALAEAALDASPAPA